MKKYQKYMMNFSSTDLRSYLGTDLINLIVEWNPHHDQLLTKERLIEMIEYLHGTSIFRNPEFRNNMLQAMNPEDIIAIRDKCLSSKEKEITDLKDLIEIISKKTWGNNNITKYLLSAWELSDNILINETIDEPVESVISSGDERFYELLDYQYYIKQRILNNLNSGNLQERMLVHMPTGTGKTKTSMHTIVNYFEFSLKKEGLIIWIAHTTELLQQAYDTFVNVWHNLGDRDCTVYKIFGNSNYNKLDTPMNGIAFIGLSKLMSIYKRNDKMKMRLKNDCRLIVFDEAHKAAAENTKYIIEDLMLMPNGYQNRALLGLSATPGRTTEKSYDNNLLSNMFGNKLINIDSDILNQINMGKMKALNTIAEENIIKYFQQRGILSKINVERLEYKKEFSETELSTIKSQLNTLSDRDYTKKQLEVFAKNKNRNKVIMEKLRFLNSEGIPTIVFACSVNHAKMLSAMLQLENIDNSLVIGDMNPADRKKAIDKFKDRSNRTNIIINFEVLTTGFDSKNIQCVFITRPTQSIVLYSQMLGRGLRGPLMGGNEECLLIDIDDNLKAYNNESAFSHFNDYWI